MFQVRDKEIPLRKDILDEYSELQIYRHYFPDIPIGMITSSPFREDKTPSFIIRVKDDHTYYHDYALGETGDVMSFVSNVYPELDRDELLKQIAKDLNNGEVPDVTYVKKNPIKKDLKIKRREYTKGDLAFWNQYGITKKTLDLFRVAPIAYYWINDTRFTCSEPAYAYDLGGEYKVYRPTKEDYRFIAGGIKIQGIDLIPQTHDILIIQKSYKDVMLCYEFGYPAMAPQSETCPISSDIITDIKQRFKRIVILYDNDEAGKKSAKTLSEQYDLECIFLTEAKDLSDHVLLHGKEYTHDTLKELLNEK
tara:strand:- start:3028 stop:3951 length:924 start_codon:yes stop_codon:yes gene_type:complete